MMGILDVVLHPSNAHIFRVKKNVKWVIKLLRWICWECEHRFASKRISNKYVSYPRYYPRY